MKTNYSIIVYLLSVLLYSYNSEGQTSHTGEETQYTIPVLFHVVLKNKQQHDSVTSMKIEKLIDLLNDDFNAKNRGLEVIHDSFKNNIANCNINFVFASKLYPENKFSDITYHYSTKKNFSYEFITNRDDDIKLKSYGYRDSKKFLNIWITDIAEPNKFGYCTPKWMVGEKRDGVVIDYQIINEAYSLTHEIGHYLGLKHLWGGVCGEILNSIGICSGDGIKDTPRQKGPSDLNDCAPRKSCEYGKYVNNQNFMDYGYCVGMFTNGQKQRMRENLLKKRSGLLKNSLNQSISDEVIVSTSVNFKDSRDNQNYSYTNIGDTKWMNVNLNYKSPNSLCYDNQDYNCDTYGRLYTWKEAKTVCPNGWRLPNSEDWEKMVNYVKGKVIDIKSEQGWINKNGVNSRGLDILPSGYYTVTRRFRGLGQRASFWLADDLGNNVNRNSRTIRDGFNQIPTSGINFAREKLSCRCIQDIDSNSQFSSNNNIQILSETKLRDKLGAPFNFSQKLPFNTNIDLTLKGFFEREIKVLFTSENLEKIGLKIIGTDKFKDLVSGKTVSQDYIYKYLDIEKTRLIANRVFPKNHVNSNKSERNLSIGIENRRQQKVKLVLLNKKTNKEDVFIVDKVYRTYLSPNSVRVLWIKLPKGNYSSKVYLQSNNNLISSTDLTLTRNNQLITIKAD